jgi:protein arginine N-methyltransferase 1
LVADHNRIQAFQNAISTAVRPGDTVCEIGTGLGTFAFMASRAGAAKVYAIEEGPIIEVAKKLYAANHKNLGEIEFIRKISTSASLPEKVDVVIYEDFECQGIAPAQESILEDARRRFLKPEGTFIPHGMELYWVPLQAEDILKHHVSNLDENQERVFGFDFGLTRKLVTHERIRTSLEAEAILAPKIQIERINFTENQQLSFTRELAITIQTHGTLHGFGSWADFLFPDGKNFSLTYEQPTTLFGRAFFPLPEPVPVDPGDHIRMNVSVAKKPFPNFHTWTWWGEITGQNGQHKYDWQRSTLQVADFQPQDIHLSRSCNTTYRPVLNQEGNVRKFILKLMDGDRSIEDIAKALMLRFPEDIPEFDKALTQVARVAKKCSTFLEAECDPKNQRHP